MVPVDEGELIDPSPVSLDKGSSCGEEGERLYDAGEKIPSLAV